MVSSIANDTKSIPDKVRYTRPCGPICDDIEIDVKILIARVLYFYAKLVTDTPGSPSTVGVQNLFIQHSMKNLTLDKVHETIYASLDFAGGRRGPHLAT